MNVGDKVRVKVPTDNNGGYRWFEGVIDKTMSIAGDDPDAFRVQFDDRLIYGGTGQAWFRENDMAVLV